MSDEPPEALRRIEERLTEASAAAERLIAEAGRAGAGQRPPPAGWQAPPRPSDRRAARLGGELELLIGGLRLLGDLAPPEVLERLVAALRELLLALRALVDFYLERLDRPRPQDRRVRDIPIE